MALFVLPWILFAVHAHVKVAPSPPKARTTEAANDEQVREGPWGTLVLTPIFISPLDSALPAGWSRPGPTTWFFVDHTPGSLRAFLNSLRLFKDEKADLLDTARWQVEADGVRITPRPETILSLDPETRAQIYDLLSRHPGNASYYHPWSLDREFFENALANANLTDETKALIRSVSYASGTRIFVADANAVVTSIADESEKLRAVRFLKSAGTYLIKLEVPPGDDLAEKLNYWRDLRLGDDMRPVLESIVQSGAGGQLDIVHLLPAFARDRLYKYPEIELAGDGVRRDCHWTSMNFFLPEPDDRLGNTAYVQEHVLENYYQSADAPSFGDVLFFTTPDGQTIHSAVYLAGNLAFTKNGDDLHQPWIIMDTRDLQDLYSAFSHAPVSQQVWKRKPGS